MCGISFVLNKAGYTANTDDFISDSLIAGQVRGLHSSGMFQVSRSNEITAYKKAVNGSEFVGLLEVDKLIKKTGASKITVSHVRHATAGNIADANAHPFIITRDDGSRLVGVHNGTLKNWKLKDGGGEHEVDSNWAFQKLADEGEDAFKFFNGAFAFVWYDTREPDIMFVARNKERPLHFIVDSKKNSMIGCSELGMLGWLVYRNNIEMDKPAQGPGYMHFEADHLYKIDMTTLTIASKTKLQAYDPTTSKASDIPFRSTYSGGGYYSSTAMYPYSRYNRHPYSSMDEDWGNPSEHFDSAFSKWESQKMGQLMTGVKEALAASRNKRYKKVSKIDAAANEIKEGIAADAKEVHDDSDILSSFLGQPVVVSDPNTTSCSVPEIKAAQDLQVLGLVVEFRGELYDDIQRCVVGEIVNAHDESLSLSLGVIRNVGTQTAKSLYINKSTTLMCVVGVQYDTTTSAPELLLADLSPESIRLLQEPIVGAQN